MFTRVLNTNMLQKQYYVFCNINMTWASQQNK